MGKLFLDFGLHAPTVSFPEPLGLMIEPTESYSKEELDRFVHVLRCIHRLLRVCPRVLETTPHFTPVARVDEVEANRNILLCEPLETLALPSGENPLDFHSIPVEEIYKKILTAHREATTRTV